MHYKMIVIKIASSTLLTMIWAFAEKKKTEIRYLKK